MTWLDAKTVTPVACEDDPIWSPDLWLWCELDGEEFGAVGAYSYKTKAFVVDNDAEPTVLYFAYQERPTV